MSAYWRCLLLEVRMESFFHFVFKLKGLVHTERSKVHFRSLFFVVLVQIRVDVWPSIPTENSAPMFCLLLHASFQCDKNVWLIFLCARQDRQVIVYFNLSFSFHPYLGSIFLIFLQTLLGMQRTPGFGNWIGQSRIYERKNSNLQRRKGKPKRQKTCKQMQLM